MLQIFLFICAMVHICASSLRTKCAADLNKIRKFKEKELIKFSPLLPILPQNFASCRVFEKANITINQLKLDMSL